MARSAREETIDPAQLQIIHIWNRCVRRAFLCGQDPLTGRDFEHRRLSPESRVQAARLSVLVWGSCFLHFFKHASRQLRGESRGQAARLSVACPHKISYKEKKSCERTAIRSVESQLLGSNFESGLHGQIRPKIQATCAKTDAS